MRSIYITLLLLTTYATYAQPTPEYRIKTYAETKREQENKVYNENYLNDIRNQRNSNVGSGGDVDKQAAKELAEQFKRNAGKGINSELEKKRMEIADREKREKEEAERKWTENYNNLKAYYKNLEPYTAQLKTKGITNGEAFFLATVFHPTKQSKKPDDYVQECRDALVTLQLYNSHKQTENFETLIYEVLLFRELSITALYALDDLEKRFPDRISALDSARLSILNGYWYYGKVEIYDDYEDRSQYYLSNDAEKAYCLALFENLFQKYPAACFDIEIQSYERYTPIMLLVEKYFNEKNKEKAFQWVDLYLLRESANNRWLFSGIEKATKYYEQRNIIWTKLYNPNLVSYGASSKFEFPDKENTKNFKEFKKYYYDKPLADWKNRAALLNIPVGYLLKFPRTVIDKNGSSLYYDNIGNLTGFDELIEKYVKDNLAENDPEAMNAWGVMLASKNKSEAIAWITKAAKAGSAWGIYNLTAATKWKLKGYGEEKLAEAQALQNQLIDKATKSQLLDLASIYKGTAKTMGYRDECFINCYNRESSAETKLASELFERAKNMK